jgi:GPH family glycoside/pentoside/hexuronide:cation symporter
MGYDSSRMAERMSTAGRALYCLGAPGYMISDRIVISIALYFYLPPSGRGFQPQVSEKIFLGVLTAFGLAMLVGRVFDALADPLVGHLSDRSRSPLGRRRSFLIYGILPMVGIPALLFWPPAAPGHPLNTVALTLLLSSYFIAFTVYVAPYLALLPEIAPTADERVRLSTLLALLSFPVMSLYNIAWPAGIELGRSYGLSGADAIRAVVVVSTGLSFILCLIPILTVDEKRFTRVVPSELSLGQAFRATISDPAFLIYLAAMLVFIFGINLVTPAVIYYATVVLGRSEIYAAVLGIPLFLAALLAFPIVIRLSGTVGPKRTMIGCTLITVPALAALGFMVPDVPGGAQDGRNLAIIWAALFLVGAAVAGFLVLPYVLIGQLIDHDAARTGSTRAAMYFGMQGFVTKWMYGISTATLAFLFSRFGKSFEEPLGVLLVGPIAAVAVLLSAGLFLLYPERRVLSETEVREQSPARYGPG